MPVSVGELSPGLGLPTDTFHQEKMLPFIIAEDILKPALR